MSNRKWMPVLPEKVSKDIDDQATVWVNTNRLYEKLALAIRSIPDENKRVQVIKVQQNALAKMMRQMEKQKTKVTQKKFGAKATRTATTCKRC